MGYNVTAIICKEDCSYLPQMPLKKRDISPISTLHLLYITIFNIIGKHGNLYFPLFSGISNRILSLFWNIQKSHTEIQKACNTVLNSKGFRSHFHRKLLLNFIHNFPASNNEKIILILL